MKAVSILFIFTTLSAGAWKWQALAPLPQPRAGYGAGVINDRLVIAGGSYWRGGQKIQSAQTDLFDPAKTRWTAAAPMPIAVSNAASAVIGGTLFILGGTDGERALRRVYGFDGVRWSERTDLILPEARTNGIAVSDSKSLFLIGGIAAPDQYSSELKSAWTINPSRSGSGWQQLPECRCTKRLILAAAVLNERLFLFGGATGKNDGVDNLSDIWSLDLIKHEWTQVGHLPEPRRAMWAAADGNRILLFGGYTDAFRNDVLLFEPLDGRITTAGNLPEPIADAKFFRVGSKWYTAGGEIGSKIRGWNTWSGTLRADASIEPQE